MQTENFEQYLTKAHFYTRSSAIAEIKRNADDVAYKFSKVTVHLTKKRHQIPFKFTQYYAK